MIKGLKINSLVLHGIKKASKGSGAEPELSEAESELPDTVRVFLQTQLSDALKHRREVIEVSNMSPLPGIVREFWSGTTSLLEASQILARNLQATQPGIGSEGLLMVADTTTTSGRAFLVAKLEHEKGTQAQMEKNSAGAMVYAMTFLTNLFFTEGSKVYKIGFFPMPPDLTAELSGFIVDRQVAGHSVATYFRESYLGCGWKVKPDLMTERYVDAVQKWIDEQPTPETRSRYQLALIADLQSTEDVLSVSNFANRYIDPKDRDSFNAFARTTLPAADITKDLNLVQSRIANLRWDTRSGTVVIATPEAFEQGVVKVEDMEAGVTRLTVTDEITKTSGTGKYKPTET
jgi:hypothetical protein